MGGKVSWSSFSSTRYSCEKKSLLVANTCANLIKLAPSETHTSLSLFGLSGFKNKKDSFFLITRYMVSKNKKTP
jgi:hypothetical protein